MRILVTGARGQVGSETVRVLAGVHDVAALDRAALDLADPDRVRAVVRELRPELVVNAAAYTAVDRAEQEGDLAYAVNGVGPGVLAEECARLEAPLLHFSTDYVFDGTKPAPYVEDDPVAPLSAYGRSKLAGERAILAAGGDAIILRTSWVYGPHGANFMLTMLRAAETRDELRVVDDQHGAPTSSLQLARLVAHLVAAGPHALRERSGVYHATAAGETTWFGFAQAIFSGRARAPRLVPITTQDWPTLARRPANSVLACDRLVAAFGERPGDWREGLREALGRLAAR